MKKEDQASYPTLRFFLISGLTLCHREWRRVFMEPSRLVGMFVQPLLFWLLFSAGFQEIFYLGESTHISYKSYFFPGVLAMVVLFSAIFSTLSLVEDRKQGFFHYALISPGGLIGAVVGKICATASLAFAQALLFLAFLSIADIELSKIRIGFLIGVIILGAFAFATLGVFFAWISPSSSAFHALMSVILLPMWLLSGSMFPLSGTVFSWLHYVNPMAWFFSLLEDGLALSSPQSAVFISQTHIILLAIFLASIFYLCIVAAKRSKNSG